MADSVCPVTGQPMVRDVRPMTVTRKGHPATFEMPGWYRDASGESTRTGLDMKVCDGALDPLRARVEGLLLPEEVLRIKKRLKLDEKGAAGRSAAGPTPFQGYASGEVPVSQAVESAPLLLDRAPSGLAILEERG